MLFETRPEAVKESLTQAEQEELIEACRAIVEEAPFCTPHMPGGMPFRVRVTSAGTWGWFASEQGYRYRRTHPESLSTWPPLPSCFEKVAQRYGLENPDSALLSLYSSVEGSLGLHQDRTERKLTHPVVCISLGETATFILGTEDRKGPKTRFQIQSGDVVVLAGKDRLAYHGVEKVKQGTCPQFLKDELEGKRLSITIRRAG